LRSRRSSGAYRHFANGVDEAVFFSRPGKKRLVAAWNFGHFFDVMVKRIGGPAMNDAEHPSPELYREAAAKLREMADQSHLPDIQGDLRTLAARFERMAMYYEAQRRHRAAGG
jgi:hypothetical protein